MRLSPSRHCQYAYGLSLIVFIVSDAFDETVADVGVVTVSIAQIYFLADINFPLSFYHSNILNQWQILLSKSVWLLLMGVGTIYRGSDGEYYGDVDLWERFESGVWTPQCWNTETGREWVETQDDEVLCLTPIARRSVAEETHLERVCGGIRVVAGQSIRR
ncbi:hypothetical protein SAMN04487948_11953 [Halogranum amylolyticum]|uniref:Uncharacterized protein n=2 Tax=Halogranum amylolyticum TaxID=660520 RepID=A0A1H8VTM7_9EURY|nr:hypothetical protein SAMN04487948_11953 [Halogranum amylolyticum]